MSKSRGPVRRGSAVVAALLVGLLLSGCAALRPGVAVQVGDETISNGELDDITSSYCDAASDSLDQQAQSVPNGYFRSGIAGLLAIREVAAQTATERGLEVGPDDYRQELEQLRDQIASLPESHRAAVEEVETARLFTQAAQVAIGQDLGGQGEDAELAAAGAEEMQRWIDDNGVEFDPALNVTLRDGQPANTDGSLSFAVSEGAKAGQGAEPNSAVAAELPDTQRCGR